MYAVNYQFLNSMQANSMHRCKTYCKIYSISRGTKAFFLLMHLSTLTIQLSILFSTYYTIISFLQKNIYFLGITISTRVLKSYNSFRSTAFKLCRQNVLSGSFQIHLEFMSDLYWTIYLNKLCEREPVNDFIYPTDQSEIKKFNVFQTLSSNLSFWLRVSTCTNRYLSYAV